MREATYLRANHMVATAFPGKRVDGGVVQVDIHFPITAVLVATRQPVQASHSLDQNHSSIPL